MRAPAIAAAVLTTVSSAAAEERDPSLTLVVPGYLYGAVAGRAPARAHGFELSIVHVPDVTAYRGFGLLGQVQSYNGSQLKTALAAEAFYESFGLELGWAFRREHAAYSSQHGVHVAPYFSIGIVSIAWRTTVPLFGGDNAYGFETGLALALKLPIPVRNWSNLGHFYPAAVAVGGRPLRDEHGEVLLPRVIERTERGAPRVDRERWLADARMEHASVESFLWLADDLDALGAPAALVTRACLAADEERRHAEACLALSGSSARLRSILHPRRRRPRPDRSTLARDAFCDGVLGEGRAARALRSEAETTRDRARARTLRQIANDEERHAALSADILAWLARSH